MNATPQIVAETAEKPAACFCGKVRRVVGRKDEKPILGPREQHPYIASVCPSRGEAGEVVARIAIPNPTIARATLRGFRRLAVSGPRSGGINLEEKAT